MYEIRRTTRVTEQLKLGGEVLDIVIVPEEIAHGYTKALAGISEAQKAIGTAQQRRDAAAAKKAVEQFGSAVIGLMTLLLGDANTQKILAFYEGNYIEMSSWITPFLISMIKPKIEKAVAGMRLQTRDAYRKAGRRGLFRR